MLSDVLFRRDHMRLYMGNGGDHHDVAVNDIRVGMVPVSCGSIPRHRKCLALLWLKYNYFLNHIGEEREMERMALLVVPAGDNLCYHGFEYPDVPGTPRVFYGHGDIKFCIVMAEDTGVEFKGMYGPRAAFIYEISICLLGLLWVSCHPDESFVSAVEE